MISKVIVIMLENEKERLEKLNAELSREIENKFNELSANKNNESLKQKLDYEIRTLETEKEETHKKLELCDRKIYYYNNEF